jgi:hypothetical protein
MPNFARGWCKPAATRGGPEFAPPWWAVAKLSRRRPVDTLSWMGSSDTDVRRYTGIVAQNAALRVEDRRHRGDDGGGGAASGGHAAFVLLLSSALKECLSQKQASPVIRLGAVVRDKACRRLIGALETKKGVHRGQLFLGGGGEPCPACATACHTSQSGRRHQPPGAVQSPVATRVGNKEKANTPLTAFVCRICQSRFGSFWSCSVVAGIRA